jgi:glycosyltransferase involved in cell wall biosynthesis
MKIAVLLPVHNGSTTLDSCIGSVVDQSVFHHNNPIEYTIFVINNLSSDDYETAIINCRNKYNKTDIVPLTCNTKGISAALNTGLIEILANPYTHVARIDVDDLWNPYKLEKQIAHMEKNKSDICGTNMVLLQNPLIEWYRYPENHSDIVHGFFGAKNNIAHPSVVIKRDVFISAGIYNQFMNGAEDFDLWCRAASCGFKFSNTQENLVLYNFVNKDTSSGELKAINRARIFSGEYPHG